MQIAFLVGDADRNQVHIGEAELAELAGSGAQVLIDKRDSDLALDRPAQEVNPPVVGHLGSIGKHSEFESRDGAFAFRVIELIRHVKAGVLVQHGLSGTRLHSRHHRFHTDRVNAPAIFGGARKTEHGRDRHPAASYPPHPYCEHCLSDQDKT